MSEIQKKVDEVHTLVKQMQEVHSRDHGDIEQIKKMGTVIEETVEKVNQLEKSIAESSVNLGGQGANPTQVSKEYKKASNEFATYLRNLKPLSHDSVQFIAKSYADKFLSGHDEEAVTKYKSLLVSSNPDGGYLVLPDRLPMRETRVFETSPVPQFAFMTTTSTNSIEIPVDYDEFDGGNYLGEDESRLETNTSKIDVKVIFANPQIVKVKATTQMLEDAAFDVEGWIMNKAKARLERRANRSYMVGTGNKGPRGMLTYPAWTTAGVYEPNKIERVRSGVDGEFGSADVLYKLQNSLKEAYQANAVWFIRRGEFYKVLTLKDGIGHYLMNTIDPLKPRPSQFLLGKPVVFADDMPSAATGSLSMLYGDIAETYTIVEKPGLRVLRNPYVDDVYVSFTVTARNGGDIVNFDSMKILELSA